MTRPFYEDSNESLVIQVNQLDYVYSQTSKRYRPNQGRAIVRPGAAVPPWVENIQTVRVETTADIDWEQYVSNPDSVPMAEVRSESSSTPLLHGVTGYKVLPNEVERIAQMGPALALNPTVLRASACQTKHEQLIDQILAGTTFKGQVFKGLAAQAANASPSATQVQLLTAATKAATGTLWSAATATEIAADLNAVVEAIRVRSSGTEECTEIVVTPTLYKLAATTFSTYRETSALELFRMANPGVRVMQWYQLGLKDAAGTGPRIIGVAGNAPDAPEFIEPRGLTPQAPLQYISYTVVPMRFTVVGVLVENPFTLCYMDGA